MKLHKHECQLRTLIGAYERNVARIIFYANPRVAMTNLWSIPILHWMSSMTKIPERSLAPRKGNVAFPSQALAPTGPEGISNYSLVGTLTASRRA